MSLHIVRSLDLSKKPGPRTRIFVSDTKHTVVNLSQLIDILSLYTRRYFKVPERTASPMDFVELPQALLPTLSLEQEQSYPFELSFYGLNLKIASHAQLSQLAGILKLLQSSC